jgi:hypothetical protein
VPDNQVKVIITGQDDASAVFDHVNEGLDRLGEAGEKLANMLETVGIAYLGEKLMEMGAQALEAGSEFAEMAQRTGVSVESLEALSYAAQQSGVSTDQMEKGIKKLQSTLTSAAQGNAKAAAALAAVGVSARDSSGQVTSAGDALDKIADKFARTADGSAKAGLAVQIFGRAGTQMIPMLDEGSAGLDELKARAEQLGLVLSTEDVDALRQLRNSFADLKDESTALMEHFLVGLEPAITELDKALTQNAGVSDMARSAGELLGDAIKGLASVAMAAGFAWDWATIKIARFVDAGIAAAHLDFRGAAASLESMVGAIGDVRIHNLETNFKNMWSAMWPDKATTAKHAKDITDSLDVVGKAAKDSSKELLAYQVAAIKGAETALKSGLELETSELENNYKHNLVTVEDYYTQKKQLAASELTTEMAALQMEGKLYDAALAKLPKTNANENERLQIMTKQMSIASQLQVLQEKLYASQGETPTGAADPLAQLAESEDIATAKAKLLGDTIQDAFSKIKDQTDQVKSKVENFQETATQGQRDINAINQQGTVDLQQMIQEYMQLAQASGNPQLITNAQKFQTQLDTLRTHVHTLGQEFVQSAQQDVNNFFEQLIEGAPKGQNAFENFAKSIIKSLDQMIAKMISTALMEKAIGFAVGSFTGGAGDVDTSQIDFGFGGNATGGPVSAGRMTMVGERGPELFVPDVAGKIVPNHQVDGMLDGLSDRAGAGSSGGYRGLASVLKIPGHAAGGVMGAGEMGIIGEEGPEMWVPDTPGTVIPNNQLGASLGSGKSGTSQTWNIDLRGADASVEQRLMRYVDVMSEKTVARTKIEMREMRLRRA